MSRRRLREVVHQVTTKAHGRKPSGSRYVGLGHIKSDARNLIGTAPASFSQGTNGVFEEGDVLFGKLRPNLRKAVQVGFGGYCSTDLLVLRPRKSVHTRYAGYVVMSESVFRHAERNSIGTRMPRTSWYAVSRAPVWLPPLEEQRRIAEILDTINETIQATERVIAKRRVLLAGLQESLLELNDGTTRTTIGDLVSGHWPGEWGEGVPSAGLREVKVLRATNLDDYGVAYSTGARRFVAGLKVAEKRLMDGDLLIEAAGGGPGVPVGRVRRFRQPADDMPYLTSNFFRALRPRTEVDSDYLFWLLDREYRRLSIWSCQQQTTGIINLQVRDYLRRPVSYHQRSQVSIARTLNAALGTVEAESRHVQKLREARAGLTADLLSGRVRTVAA